MPVCDLRKVYDTIIRPGTEYCSTIYHSLIPRYMAGRLESVQRQALKIIYGWNKDLDQMFDDGLIETLEDRREKACLKFAIKAEKKITKVLQLVQGE